MDVNNLQGLYEDYLLASTKMVTSTGLSSLLDGAVSHDKITRFLAQSELDSKSLWLRVKSMVEEICSSDDVIVLSFDDTIQAKPHTTTNELVCWHWDHTQNRAIKGVQFLSGVINTKGISLPIAAEFILKDKIEVNPLTGKKKRKSSKSKNELFRQMADVCSTNTYFDYIVVDSWYASVKNMEHIKRLNSEFIMAIKSNRTVALSATDKRNGKYTSIRSLALEQGSVEKVWFKGLDFPLLLTKQVFKNGDDTEGTLYLVASDLSLSYERIAALYKKRWCAEEYHKSIKQNSSLGKSPTKTVKTQRNHFYLSLFAYAKMELLKVRHNQNHFALKTKIYMNALKKAMEEIGELSTPGYKKVA